MLIGSLEPWVNGAEGARRVPQKQCTSPQVLVFRDLLHVTIPANVSAFFVNEVFLRFRLVDPALLDMLNVA
jgi:hypothetical protein